MIPDAMHPTSDFHCKKETDLAVERGKRERGEGEGNEEANRKRREPDAPNSKR
jgi:hypothetical protein